MILQVVIGTAVVLRAGAAVRGWVVLTQGAVTPRLARTTFRWAFVIFHVVIGAAVVLRLGATVRSRVVFTQGGIASRLAWTALRLA